MDNIPKELSSIIIDIKRNFNPKDDRWKSAVDENNLNKAQNCIGDSFTWQDTIEGHDFWKYVWQRLGQIKNGVGIKVDDD